MQNLKISTYTNAKILRNTQTSVERSEHSGQHCFQGKLSPQKTLLLVCLHLLKIKIHSLGTDTEKHIFILVRENFYHYQGHLKFVCILFCSILNNFRSQITGARDQSAFWWVQETQELYAMLWYSTSIFQFGDHLTCTRTPWDGRKEWGGVQLGLNSKEPGSRVYAAQHNSFYNNKNCSACYLTTHCLFRPITEQCRTLHNKSKWNKETFVFWHLKVLRSVLSFEEYLFTLNILRRLCLKRKLNTWRLH